MDMKAANAGSAIAVAGSGNGESHDSERETGDSRENTIISVR